MKIQKRRMFAALAVMMLLTVGAQASIISQDFVFGDLPKPPGSPLSDFPMNITFNLFNSYLGNLNSVTIELETWVTPQLNALNFSANPAELQLLSGTTKTTATVFGTISTSTTTLSSEPGLPKTIPGFTAHPWTGPTQYENAIAVLISGLDAWQHAGPPLQSGTPVVLSVPQAFAEGGCLGGDCYFNSVPNVYGALHITYDFTFVPEPVSMILVGSSLLGLGFISRRRSRKAAR